MTTTKTTAKTAKTESLETLIQREIGKNMYLKDLVYQSTMEEDPTAELIQESEGMKAYKYHASKLNIGIFGDFMIVERFQNEPEKAEAAALLGNKVLCMKKTAKEVRDYCIYNTSEINTIYIGVMVEGLNELKQKQNKQTNN